MKWQSVCLVAPENPGTLVANRLIPLGGKIPMKLKRRSVIAGLAVLPPIGGALAAPEKSDPQLDRDAAAALRRLLANNESARKLNATALAVLVFPKIVKVGFLLGGAYGEGAMMQGGRTVGYYNSAAASYGLQAGAQWFGYALFFMNAKALSYLDSSDGFQVGVGPSVVVVDSGMAKNISSTTLTQDVYAIIFNQKGLMAGLGIEGSKITKI
jgi:lipid-binding SYLF domain-containing protein